MRTNFKYLFITAMLILGLASCDKDDDKNNPGQEGVPTEMKIAVTQAGATFSTRDDNANAAEALFKVVDVFIYNAGTNALEKHVQLNGDTDFTFEDTGNGIYVGNASIATTTGQKHIYIGVNLPSALTSEIVASGPSTVKSVANTEILTNATDGFAMFSDQVIATTLVVDSQDPANTITARVKRLVAKIALQAHSTLSLNVSGGILSEVMFNPRNANTKFFPLQFNDAGVIKDPNWATQADGVVKGADLYQPDASGYIPINSSAVINNKALASKYALENTAQSPYADELTYISVRAKFVPSSIKVYTNGTDASGGFTDQTNTGNSAVTFYRLPLVDGSNVYTTDLTVINDYANINGVNPLDIKTYSEGFCYYNLYMNPASDFNIFRNDFYKVTITRINGLGRPSAEDDGHVLLELPTDINVNIEVIDWNLIDIEGQLPGGR